MVYFTHNKHNQSKQLWLLCHTLYYEKLTNTEFEVIQLRMGALYATEDFAE